jgi:hypothetical protein
MLPKIAFHRLARALHPPSQRQIGGLLWQREPAEAQHVAPDETHEVFPPAEGSASNEGQEAPPPEKGKWVSRVGSFGDYQAGVRLIEDRQNRRMTIQSREKPSVAVCAVMKAKQHGFPFDDEDQVW